MDGELNLSLSVPVELNPRRLVLQLRGTKEDPEFNVAEVCEMLGYEDVPDAVRDWAVRLQKANLSFRAEDPETRGEGRPRTYDKWWCREPEFYKIVLGCGLPNAEAGLNWVCHDVLPSIRRFGCYPPPESGLQPLDAGEARLVGTLEKLIDRILQRPYPVGRLWTVHERCREMWPKATANDRKRVREIACGLHLVHYGERPMKSGTEKNSQFTWDIERLHVLDQAIRRAQEEAMGGPGGSLFNRPKGEAAHQERRGKDAGRTGRDA